MILYYDLNDLYRDGQDSIHVNVKNFPLNVPDDTGLTKDELYSKYKNEALEKAAYELMCEYADIYMKG